MEGSIQAGKGLLPVGKAANGGCGFTFAGKHYLFYPYADHATSYRYLLAQGDTYDACDQFAPLWTFPAQGLGNVKNSGCVAACATQPGDEGQHRLYIYAPGNGIAAYTLTQQQRGDVNADGKIDVSDATALINAILGTAHYPTTACDLNADGEVNVSDVTTLVNKILK
ncbi:MAG: dockerin type I domain-containing protein [Bacteroidales bacterium]|nr:dockerin type I domain-containing protein [Bacteroidales bacterium]